ncbi:unnamed protein product [Meloidogyne enterolobii]|uniref:Uncharacterized protein n=1 Tax=Meloidogyne enterolobii TaxID=390850 RepID=A0ACB1ABF3_MELEN
MAAPNQPIQNAFNLPLPLRIMPYGIVAAAVGVASYFVLCAVNLGFFNKNIFFTNNI